MVSADDASSSAALAACCARHSRIIAHEFLGGRNSVSAICCADELRRRVMAGHRRNAMKGELKVCFVAVFSLLARCKVEADRARLRKLDACI